jgi:hypothetical protein
MSCTHTHTHTHTNTHTQTHTQTHTHTHLHTQEYFFVRFVKEQNDNFDRRQNEFIPGIHIVHH